MEVDLDPVTQGAVSELPELAGLPAADLLLLNDGDLTFGKIRFDERGTADLVELLPACVDPLARAVMWGAAWELLRDAELSPRKYVDLVSHGLGREDHPAVLDRLLTASRRFPVDLCLTGPDAGTALGTLATAFRELVTTAEPGSARQFVGVRGLATAAAEPADLDQLAGWLAGAGLPDGVELDAELRWTLLSRLVVTGRAGRAEIEAERHQDTSAHGAVHAERCLAALPDEAAKATAWERLTGTEPLSNRFLGAIADGFWQPEQLELTRPYEQRYFTDLPAFAARQSDWMAMIVGRRAYPRYSVDERTAVAADRLLATVESTGLRRAVVDETYEVFCGLSLAVRKAF
ncbi:ERAP1-like C-terminal domain-containing protein, partial [Fodinicola feengrottensis]|uniref:ERAP1-like C-terminal domain-containing protein n=1 Tax=Fodinicola feengrottensis TaxID=435914 RepID=UPI0024423269